MIVLQLNLICANYKHTLYSKWFESKSISI